MADFGAGQENAVEASKRDETVWVVKCTNGNYRMRLIPGMAAKVERIN